MDEFSDENNSPFECGFDFFSGRGFSFSISFFSISLMFLLFDVEILLLCFYPLIPFFSFFSSFMMRFILFIIFFATVYEWVKGVIRWV